MEKKTKIQNGGRICLKRLRIISIIGLIFALCFVGAASAAEWDGWTYADSPYERFSPEWVQDVQQHAATYIYDPSMSFEERAKAQSYVLGWDDRITYVDEHGTIDEGHMDENAGEWIEEYVDEETGETIEGHYASEWVEGTGAITYDWGFFGNLFGWGVPENLFQNKSEYDAALTIYYENYNAAVQSVPREV